MKNFLLIPVLFLASLASGQNPIFFQSAFNTATAATPTFLPVAGTYTGTQSVTISTATSGCGSYIYWSTVHNPPTIADTNGTAVSVTTSETVYAKVIGCPGYNDSPVGSAAYTINVPPSILPSAACFGTGASTTFTTPAVVTTGAKVVVVTISSVAGGTTSVVDNLTTHTLTCPECNIGHLVEVAHELLPSTTGSATFTVNAAVGPYAVVCVLPMTGLVGTYDANETYNGSGTSSCQAGSITPGAGTHMTIAAYESTNGSNASINSSYTTPVQLPQVGGFNVAGGGSSLVIGTATNPTWSGLSSASVCSIESYQ